MVDEAAEVFSGPLTPDAIRLPARPVNLKATVQNLTEIINDLKNVSSTYKQANTDGPGSGRLVRAIAHVAQVTGLVLEGDTEQLQNLCDAIQHEAEILSSSQSAQLPELRQRWESARSALRDAVEEENRRAQKEADDKQKVLAGAGAGHGGGGHHGGGHGNGSGTGGAQAPADVQDINPAGLVHSLEADAFDHYAQIFHRATGASFTTDRGQTHAMMLESGSPLDAAMTTFSKTLHGIFEEYSDVARRVLNADDEIEAKLLRHDRTVATAQPVADPGAAPQVGVSSVDDVQKLSDTVRTGNSSLNNLSQKLQQAAESLNQGRLKDHGDEGKHVNGTKFAQTWDAHFDGLRHNVNQALEHAGTIAQKMQQLDEQGAGEVRRAGKVD